MRKCLKDFFFTFSIPLFYLSGPGLIYLTQARVGLFSQLLGLSITTIGLVFWFGGYFSLGFANFSVLPSVKALKTKGFYQITAHPIYLGIFLTFLGLSLATGSTLGLVYTFFAVLPLNLYRARLEERKLKNRFGKTFQKYKKSKLF